MRGKIKNIFTKTNKKDREAILRYAFISSLGLNEGDLEFDATLDAYAAFILEYGSASWMTFQAPKDYKIITVTGFGKNPSFSQDGSKVICGLYVDCYSIDPNGKIKVVKTNDSEGIVIS